MACATLEKIDLGHYTKPIMSPFPALLELLFWFLLVACKPNKLISHQLAFGHGILDSDRKETRAPAEVMDCEICM